MERMRDTYWKVEERGNDEQTNELIKELKFLIDEKIQRCGDIKNLRGIVQLIGIWQLDNNAVNEAGKEIENLGVCQQHFIRGKFCLEHSISIGGKNLLLPYIGHRLCPILQINELFTVSAKLQVSRFLCCDCYKKHDGHLYVRPGKEKVIQECETQAIEQSLNTTSDESSFANNNYDNPIPIYKSPTLEEPQSLEEYCSALLVELYNLLNVLVSVSGVTRRYERCLETQRMELANPTLRIQQFSNIWNVCVIDNIDFKEKTFTYGNIYNITHENTKLFEENSITKEVIIIFNSIFIQLLNFHINNDFSIQYSSSYNVEIFNEKIRNHFCNNNLLNYPPAHLVILEASDNPNNDANINAACEQYFNDLKINNNSKIEVVGDETIFRRILKYY
ncbi:hypothetical protein Glove_395g65 [Diversispora epigaea]|uniref:Uncharacterized protein n=1 Tax=Diversispora epigaea TaxID=1348612 RepID=A0A397H9E0_9GLOM|nr:hypothetical protein Glove_395g65 [Diversispora epigaea]